jgi:hypothetical protein
MQKFELKPWNRGITNEAIIEDMKRVAALLGKASLTYDEYDQEGTCRARTAEVRLGGWNKALLAAGLEVSRKYLTEEDLFENLLAVWLHLGRQPTSTDMRDKANSGSKFGRNTYANRFGSWRKALESFVVWANEDVDVLCPEPKKTRATSLQERAPSDRLRFRVMLRDNFKCQYCGVSPATHTGVVLHLDHREPFSQGGRTDFDNLITSCSKCNLGKGDLSAIATDR